MNKANNRTNRTNRTNTNDVITVDNVRDKGESTAIRAVKTMLGRDASPYMRKTYQNLCRDIDFFNIEGYTLTSSYDSRMTTAVYTHINNETELKSIDLLNASNY